MIPTLIFSVAGCIAIALHYGNRCQKRATEGLLARLEAARLRDGIKTFDADELIGLPAPVQRYFQVALTRGQRMVSAVRIEQSGTINMSAGDEDWKRFTSAQRVTAHPPGFLWAARIGMIAGLSVRVNDAYVAGEGILTATLFGLLSLANLRGTTDMARGELMRFFAEAAWYPTALLPSQGVRWQAADDSSALGTLKDGQTSVTLLFRFNENGLIGSVRAEARGRAVGRNMVPTPWEGRWSDYQTSEGMCIPSLGEVSWMINQESGPYWRGRVTRVEYEFALSPSDTL